MQVVTRVGSCLVQGSFLFPRATRKCCQCTVVSSLLLFLYGPMYVRILTSCVLARTEEQPLSRRLFFVPQRCGPNIFRSVISEIRKFGSRRFPRSHGFHVSTVQRVARG